MYGRMQEDVAWTRLQDMQRELENRRLYGRRPGLPSVALILERVWLLAGLAYRRAPRRRPATARKSAF
jgi:transposase InsO family protein